MNYSNENLLMNNQIQIKPKTINEYIKTINYPLNNINKGKITIKKQKIKQENINPEIIEINLKEVIHQNMPKPIQNLEPYQKKEKQKKNQILENIELNNKYPIPKHSIKSSNSSKINTKITNKKYLNKNKINSKDNSDNIDNIDNFDNDILYKNYSNNNISKNNFNIFGQIKTKKISNFNSINNKADLKMTKSSIQIKGNVPNKINNQPWSKISSFELNIEGGNSPQKNFHKKNSYNKNINLNYKNKTNLTKKEFDNNSNTNYNCKSENIIKQLKKNKININNTELMGLDNYNKDINFVQSNHDYNNIFFYNSKNKANINENYTKYINNNNNININSKNKFIYKKTKNIKQKEEPKKTAKKKEIKNNLKNNYDIVDFIINLSNKKETISINIKQDNIKEKIENIIKNNDLNDTYYEPLFSIVNNSINILNNVNKFKISKHKKMKKENLEELNDSSENMDYSLILDLMEKNKYEEFIEKIYPDIDEINENKNILNMSI